MPLSHSEKCSPCTPLFAGHFEPPFSGRVISCTNLIVCEHRRRMGMEEGVKVVELDSLDIEN